MLTRCEVRTVAVRRPAELDDLDAIVLPGGESTTMSKLAVEFGVFEPLQKRLLDGLPAFGSCAGMIMLATEVLDGRPDQQSFGAIDITVRRNAFGRQVDSFESDVDLDGVDDAFHAAFQAVFIRAPVVERVGEGVEILGRVNTGRIVAVRQRNVLATAFHPELTGDLRVHRLFVDMARRAKSTE